jgi:MFS-type transporter involved in bile tolerance (Atg22 family)
MGSVTVSDVQLVVAVLNVLALIIIIPTFNFIKLTTIKLTELETLVKLLKEDIDELKKAVFSKI